jgi:glycosyltransferase involved in cell wall biosynthesis
MTQTPLADKTLLILARWFPPDMSAGSFRSIRFCNDLPHMGWRCKVITPDLACGTNVRPDSLDMVSDMTEVLRFRCGNIAEHMERVTSNPSTGPAKTFLAKVIRKTLQVLRAPDLHVWSLHNLFKAVQDALRHNTIDAILITAPPFSWMTLADKIKSVTDTPILLDFRDPWTSNMDLYGGRRAGICAKMERRCLAAADGIIYNTPGAMEFYTAAYPDMSHDAWSVITNSFIREQIEAVQPESFDRTTLVYGGVGRTAMVCKLAEAIATLKNDKTISNDTFQFISYGDEPDAVTRTVQDLGVSEMVKFRGYCSQNEVLASLRGASGLLLLVEDAHTIHVPGKLYEYIGSGSPTLMIGPADSNAARILAETGAGRTVKMTTESIAQGLRALVSGDMTASIDRDAIMSYETKATSRKLVDLLERIIDRKN